MFLNLLPPLKLSGKLCKPGQSFKKSMSLINILSKKDPQLLKNILCYIQNTKAAEAALGILGGIEAQNAAELTAILHCRHLSETTQIRAAQRLLSLDREKLEEIASVYPEYEGNVRNEILVLLGKVRKITEKVPKGIKGCPYCGGKVENVDCGGEYWNGDHSCGWVEDWKYICQSCMRSDINDFSVPLYDEVVRYEPCE